MNSDTTMIDATGPKFSIMQSNRYKAFEKKKSAMSKNGNYHENLKISCHTSIILTIRKNPIQVCTSSTFKRTSCPPAGFDHQQPVGEHYLLDRQLVASFPNWAEVHSEPDARVL